MNDFKIGQIFEGTYPPEAALWCNQNRAYIEEIKSVIHQETEVEQLSGYEYDEDGYPIHEPEFEEKIVDVTVRRFQIVAIPEPTEAEKAKARIAELEIYLASTDWYAVRYAETGVPVPEYVRQARADAREEISTLRETSI